MPVPGDSDLGSALGVPLTEEEKRQLAGILKCNLADLGSELAPYVRAATTEYVRMFLGQRVFTRGSDIREHRLFLLISEAFGNRIPDEQRVCDLFQTTSSQSRSLIRSVMSKYQYQLQEAINSTLSKAVGDAQPEGDGWILTINSDNVVDALNRCIQAIDGSLPQIERRRGTVSSYVLKKSSYDRLRQQFNL